ncbi:MAG: hypothetical protein K0U66_08880 [Gammaproteobacteria bacterium]|nr:hypothetical protein [Gammaproteobacteria bacterium]
MVNTVNLTTDPITGVRGLHLVGVNNQRTDIDEIIPAHGAKLSPIENGEASLPIFDKRTLDQATFTFPLVPHDDDPVDKQGLNHWQQITDHIGEHDSQASHGVLQKVFPLWLVEVNKAFKSIANIFARLQVLEANNPPPIIFDNWVVQNQELRLNVGGSTGDDCIIDMSHGYTLCPSRIAGQPADSLERMVSILVNGTVSKLHVFSWGDTGSIADAVRANRDTQTRGTPRPTGTT